MSPTIYNINNENHREKMAAFDYDLAKEPVAKEPVARAPVARAPVARAST